MGEIFLPKLVSIKVENYSLYATDPTFEFDFQKGISAIIGVNGIGKTTLVEMILYSILGYERKPNKKNKFENDSYFKVRMSKEVNYNEEAKVHLTFKLGQILIKVCRSLMENKIICFNIEEEIYHDISYETYENKILEVCGFTEFKYFNRVVRNFLVFNEQRNNISWEENYQDELFRIILFEKEAFTEFENIEIAITKADTKGRHASENARILTEANDKDRKEKSLKNAELSNIDIGSLFNKKEKYEEDYNYLTAAMDQFVEEINELCIKIGIENSHKEECIILIDNLEKRIDEIDNKLYNGLYEQLPDFYIDLEKAMLSKGECLICGAKSNKIQQLAEKHAKEKKCLLCGSDIKEHVEIPEDLVNQLNLLSLEKNKKINVLNNYKRIIDDYNKIIIEKNTELISSRNRLESLKIEIQILESQIIRIQNQENYDKVDQTIKEREESILQLEEKKNEAYEERDYLKKELQNKHKNFSNKIRSLNHTLSEYFNKYASTFLGVDCELAVRNKDIKGIPHTIYYPMINGDVRGDISSVSESQRFFIDQAFRMAIIEYLQKNTKGFETFFITETPEGSLDYAYEIQVASMFKIFAKSGNNIVFTSNLNDSRFLREIFRDLEKENIESRVLNLLYKGRVTRIHTNNMPNYDDIIKRILEG